MQYESIKERKLSKRTLVASILILFVIPITILYGVFGLNDRKYYYKTMEIDIK